MIDMKLDPRWLNDVQETLKHLLIEAARDGEMSETQAEKLATFALNGFTSLSEQWKDIRHFPAVAIRLSEKSAALQRRLLALHKQITGERFDQGCGEENDYPRTQVGFALERLSDVSCDLHLINGVLDSIEAALATSTEDWAEVLDQRQREVETFKERGIPLPEKSTTSEAEAFEFSNGMKVSCTLPANGDANEIIQGLYDEFARMPLDMEVAACFAERVRRRVCDRVIVEINYMANNDFLTSMQLVRADGIGIVTGIDVCSVPASAQDHPVDTSAVENGESVG